LFYQSRRMSKTPFGIDSFGQDFGGHLSELLRRPAEALRVAQARRARGQHVGRPRSLDKSKSALAQRMHASGESASTIAATLGVSRATVYRVLAEQTN
jgi:hypothetical protein